MTIRLLSIVCALTLAGLLSLWPSQVQAQESAATESPEVAEEPAGDLPPDGAEELAGDLPPNAAEEPLAEDLPPDPIQVLGDRQDQIQQVYLRAAPSIVALGPADPELRGWGSGVIVNEKGLILTAGHVTAATGDDIIVYLKDGRQLAGRRLGANMNRDASMVQILTSNESQSFPYVEVAEPDTAELGDWVVALGHPGGYDPTRPAPLRIGRVIQKQGKKLLITDCTLSGGDSGGALFDLKGRLIGIHSSIAQSLSHNIHVTMAVFHKHWERMEKGEHWGELTNLFEEPLPGYESKVDRSKNRALLGANLDKRTRNGILVREVRPGFPAAKAGLRRGDVIIRFDGQEVSQYTELFPLLSSMDPGDEVDLLVKRRGQELALRATMGDRAKLLGEAP